MTKVHLIDYGFANIRSVVNAFEYLGAEVTIAVTAQDIVNAERIVLPGVGSFDAAMQGLRERNLIDPLNDAVRVSKRPFLGICLGLQLLFEASEEGVEPGLGWFSGTVRRFPCGPDHPKIPHMGWNSVILPHQSQMFAEMAGEDFYFVHSYYVANEGEARTVASALCEYGLSFVAALESENVMACQFHPEKSQLAGMKLLQNFLAPPQTPT